MDSLTQSPEEKSDDSVPIHRHIVSQLVDGPNMRQKHIPLKVKTPQRMQRFKFHTKEECQLKALSYTTQLSFYVNSYNYYHSAVKLNCLNEICSHMTPPSETIESLPRPLVLETMTTLKPKKANFVWSKEDCFVEAIKYSCKREFRLTCPSAYNSARTNDWLDDICSHMTVKKFHTRESCEYEALKYSSKSLFRIHSQSAYNYAARNGFLNEICSHMISDNKAITLPREEEEVHL